MHSTSTVDLLSEDTIQPEKPDVYRKTTDVTSITLKWRPSKNPSKITGLYFYNTLL